VAAEQPGWVETHAGFLAALERLAGGVQGVPRPRMLSMKEVAEMCLESDTIYAMACEGLGDLIAGWEKLRETAPSESLDCRIMVAKGEMVELNRAWNMVCECTAALEDTSTRCTDIPRLEELFHWCRDVLYDKVRSVLFGCEYMLVFMHECTCNTSGLRPPLQCPPPPLLIFLSSTTHTHTQAYFFLHEEY
jgi:hypothetical protein